MLQCTLTLYLGFVSSNYTLLTWGKYSSTKEFHYSEMDRSQLEMTSDNMAKRLAMYSSTLYSQ